MLVGLQSLVSEKLQYPKTYSSKSKISALGSQETRRVLVEWLTCSPACGLVNWMLATEVRMTMIALRMNMLLILVTTAVLRNWSGAAIATAVVRFSFWPWLGTIEFPSSRSQGTPYASNSTPTCKHSKHGLRMLAIVDVPQSFQVASSGVYNHVMDKSSSGRRLQTDQLRSTTSQANYNSDWITTRLHRHQTCEFTWLTWSAACRFSWNSWRYEYFKRMVRTRLMF